MFVYTAAYEGSLAAQNAVQQSHLKRNYRALPWVIFTDPQVAGVGLDEQQAEAAGIDFEVPKLPLDQVPRSLAARDTRGFIKLIRDRETDRLVGARILAPEGAELLMEATCEEAFLLRSLTRRLRSASFVWPHFCCLDPRPDTPPLSAVLSRTGKRHLPIETVAMLHAT